jgi:hypothetical protein
MYGITPVTGHTLLLAAGTGPVADAPCGEAIVLIYVLKPQPALMAKMSKLRLKCWLTE